MSETVHSGSSDDQSRITQAELIEMFGETMPMEAVELIWNSPDDKTVGQIRAELRHIATRRGAATEAKPVARIARAIQEAANNGADSPVDYGDAEALARAALLAIRRPSQAMVEAGMAEAATGDMLRFGTAAVFNAMIDKALEE